MTSPADQSSGRTFWIPEREDITIYGVLSALADPTRLAVVRALADSTRGSEGQCVSQLFPEIGKQNLTHHMKVLREAGLVDYRYEGRNKFSRLRRELIDDLFPGLLDGLLNAIAESARQA
ncbi:MAG: ArsR/SmtB family transcription factor [Vulcanimicrobiaceae bacterium]